MKRVRERSGRKREGKDKGHSGGEWRTREECRKTERKEEMVNL